jgi:mono/diheme cytochrome c family protein
MTGAPRSGSSAGLKLAAALAVLAAACSAPSPAGTTATADPWSQLPAVVHPDAELGALPARAQSYQALCNRGRGDAFARALCERPARPDLKDLSSVLALAGLGEQRAFALTANSTSLVVKSVSPLNPRVVVFPRVGADLAPPAALTAVGFVRGDQFVEVVSHDPTTQDLNFYVVAFEQACNYTDTGCGIADLLTEDIEHNWTAYSVYDQGDLEPTSFDCLSCHRQGGPTAKRFLRMQELESPWLHWFPQRFMQRTESDRVLTDQFVTTHAHDSQYGGIPISTIAQALDEGSGAQLEALIRATGFAAQPNPFDARIARETSAGTSDTWQQRRSSHLKGEAIAVPYPAIDVSDATKRDAAQRSYLDVTQGLAPRTALVDARDIFSQDAQLKLSLLPEPSADGRTVLLQMCARCHNGQSDPTLAKSRFNVFALDALSPSEKSVAIARINATGPERMPPWRSGALTPQAIAAITTELQK